MARGFRGNRRAAKDANRRVKKKPCTLCRDRIEWIDYKDVALLRKFMSDRGKIRSRRVTGNCAQHQRGVAQAIKTARELVLLPYTQRMVTERPGGRARVPDAGPPQGVDQEGDESAIQVAADVTELVADRDGDAVPEEFLETDDSPTDDVPVQVDAFGGPPAGEDLA